MPGWPNVSPLPMTRDEMDAALLAAFARGDKAGIAALYAQAADTGPAAEAAFFLTHAYVFALEAGLPEAADHRARLVAMGAES